MFGKLSAAAALLMFLISTTAANERVKMSLKFENQTAGDVTLSFTPQRVQWKYEKLKVWCDVKNVGSEPLEFVAVSVTALDKERNFLGREKWYVDPSDLAPGEKGHVDGYHLDTDQQVPAIIQIRLSGDN